MSLNALKKDSFKSRGETTQNRNTLKDAVSGVLNDVKKEKTFSQIKKIEEKETIPVETKTQTPFVAGGPKEIPEDVLRGMLDV
jgi:hypothetical protein